MDAVLVLLHLLQYAAHCKHSTNPIWVLKFDQRKAFDCLRQDWLLECLGAYGVEPNFLTFVKELYCHPTVCQTIEGHLTEPIPLQCGLPQGNLLSLLLYNISLQPLLDYAHRHRIGTALSWDPSHPYTVSTLAFVDDILLVFSKKEDLRHFMVALNLYKMASNGKVNGEKSWAFKLLEEGGDVAFDDTPFDILSNNQTDFVHLGQAFSITGGVLFQTLEQALQVLQTKMNLLSTKAAAQEQSPSLQLLAVD